MWKDESQQLSSKDMWDYRVQRVEFILKALLLWECCNSLTAKEILERMSKSERIKSVNAFASTFSRKVVEIKPLQIYDAYSIQK